MTKGVLTSMVGCESTSGIWSKLTTYFAAQTRAKVSQLKLLLHNIKKDSLTINDFLSKVKNIIDCLVSVGHILSPSDHNEAIFNGLPIEYDILSFLYFKTRKILCGRDWITSIGSRNLNRQAPQESWFKSSFCQYSYSWKLKQKGVQRRNIKYKWRLAQLQQKSWST